MTDQKKGLWICANSQNVGKVSKQLIECLRVLGVGGHLKVTSSDAMALEAENQDLRNAIYKIWKAFANEDMVETSNAVSVAITLVTK